MKRFLAHVILGHYTEPLLVLGLLGALVGVVLLGGWWHLGVLTIIASVIMGLAWVVTLVTERFTAWARRNAY